MKKYYIGLIVLALLAGGLLIYIVGLGVQGRDDKKTYEAASKAADKLNSYINDKQQIPDSLAKAGITDVPGTIKYEKLSSTRYKFCATFKTDRGYSTGAGSVVTDTLFGTLYGGQFDYDSYGESSYEPSSLYLSYYYRKGENCQTVKPYLRSSNSFNFSNDFETDFSDLYQESYNQYCTPTIPEGYEAYCQSLQSNL